MAYDQYLESLTPEERLRVQIRREIIDDLDEEFELSLEEEAAGGSLDEEEKAFRRVYFRELVRLQGELVRLQDWVKATGHRLVVLFEGRDAAGKGGAIKRIAQRLNPRICRVAALPAPNDRERTQWYFQRYIAHLPAAGEIVLFDRSWYNRAGVERVMGFCTDEQYEEFFRSVPEFERMLVRSGIQVVKYWFSITDDEQEARFRARIEDPLKQWKLSPMDLESRRRWELYTGPRKSCSNAPVFLKRRGGLCRVWIKNVRASTAFPICCLRCRMKMCNTLKSCCPSVFIIRIMNASRRLNP